MTTTAPDIITRDQQASISTRRLLHAGDLLSVLLLLLYSFSSFHLLNDMLRKGEKTSFYYEMQYDCLYTHIVDGRHTSSIYIYPYIYIPYPFVGNGPFLEEEEVQVNVSPPFHTI